MAMEPTRQLFTVEDYYRMAEVGIIRPDARVELIEGEVITKDPIGPPQANCITAINRLFVSRLGDVADVRVRSPVHLDDLSEPDPDVALVRHDRDRTGHPGPGDVLLVVEVAETSFHFDRQVKLPLYARAGIPEVWIVDLPRHGIEAYRDVGPAGYATSSRAVAGSIVMTAFPDVKFDVAEILGSRS